MTNHAFNPLSPFLPWTSLAMKTWEMMFASAQVIGHRTGRLALAGPVPNARDRKEFHRMGQEKVEAAMESLQAVAIRTFSFHQQLALSAYRQWVSTWSDLIALAGSRTIPQTIKVQNDIINGTMSQVSSVAAQVGESFAHALHKGLTPIHSRATANARRLSRTRLLQWDGKLRN